MRLMSVTSYNHRSSRAVIPTSIFVVVLCLVACAIGVASTAFSPLSILAACLGMGYLCVAMARPSAAIMIIGVLLVFTEDDLESPFKVGFLYHPAPYGISALNCLIILFAGGVALRRIRHRQHLLTPGPLSPVCWLLLALVPFALYNGFAAGQSFHAMSHEAAGIVMLVVVIFATANWVTTERRLLTSVKVLTALVVLRSLISVLIYGNGIGIPVYPGSSVVTTSLDPATNFLRVIVILGGLAFVVRRLATTWRPVAFAALPAVALYYSYRRSFILGLAIAAAFVIVLGGVMRPVLRTLCVLIITVAMVLVIGASGDPGTESGSVTESTLLLDNFGSNRSEADSYRSAERRNVVSDLSKDSLTGLGFAVPYTREYPQPYVPGIDAYVHVAALWFWMKLGGFGLLAYLALLVISIVMVSRAYRYAPSRAIRAVMLAAGGSMIALVFADATGSFTGVDPRFVPVAGFLFGVIAAGYRLRTASGVEIAED
jgi:hypothetical protein